MDSKTGCKYNCNELILVSYLELYKLDQNNIWFIKEKNTEKKLRVPPPVTLIVELI